MDNDNALLENIDTIAKFLKQLDRTFEDAKACRKCSESCGDIFYNGYKRSKNSLEALKTLIAELNEKVAELEDIEKEEKVTFIIPDEIEDEQELEIKVENKDIEYNEKNFQEPFVE